MRQPQFGGSAMQRSVIAHSSIVRLGAVLVVWVLGATLQPEGAGSPFAPLEAEAGAFVVRSSPTLPSSAPPSRTPTRKPTDEPTSTSTPTRPAVATQQAPGLPLQGGVFSPTPAARCAGALRHHRRGAGTDGRPHADADRGVPDGARLTLPRWTGGAAD